MGNQGITLFQVGKRVCRLFAGLRARGKIGSLLQLRSRVGFVPKLIKCHAEVVVNGRTLRVGLRCILQQIAGERVRALVVVHPSQRIGRTRGIGESATRGLGVAQGDIGIFTVFHH